MKFIRKTPIYESYYDDTNTKQGIMKNNLDAVRNMAEHILFKYLISPEWFFGKISEETNLRPGKSKSIDYVNWNSIADKSAEDKHDYLQYVIKYDFFIENNKYIVGIPMTTEHIIVFKGNAIFDYIDALEAELRNITSQDIEVRLEFDKGQFALTTRKNIECIDIKQNVNIGKLCKFLSRFIRLEKYYGNLRLRVWNRTKYPDMTELKPISDLIKFKDVCVIVTKLYARKLLNSPIESRFFDEFSLNGIQDILINHQSNDICAYISDLFTENVVNSSPVNTVRLPNSAEVFTPDNY